MKEKQGKLPKDENGNIESNLDELFEKIFNKADFLWSNKYQKQKKESCKQQNNKLR